MLSQILVPHGETKAVYNRLFIGDYYTLRHHQHHHQFTHVLSCMPLEQRQETWAYTEVDGARAKNRSRKTRKLIFRRWKIVNVLDTPREQFELHFHECADFIHKCLSDTSASGDNDGKVYVHCVAGMSRSVTAVLSYLIKYHAMDYESAMDHVRDCHPIACPNEGFVRQLQRFAAEVRSSYEEQDEAGGISISGGDVSDITHSDRRPRIGVADPAKLVARTTAQRKDNIYCKKCRHLMFHKRDTYEHTPQQKSGQKRFAYNKQKKDAQQVSTQSFGAYCSSFFLNHMTWMEPMGEVEGPLQCPKCQAKVGSYKWVGAQCSCGKWITPALQVLKSKVDFHEDDGI